MAYQGKKRAPGVIMGALLFSACLPAIEASAQPGAAERVVNRECVGPPRSTLIVNVKDKGASADGSSDDTAAIQAAIDEVGGTGGSVFVPDGAYLVATVGDRRLRLKSDMRLTLAPGATLKAIPNDAEHYSVLHISGASDVTVTGGTLEGDRGKHAGTTGEWGMGIRIDGGAERIAISGVKSRNMWGDGFYVHGAKGVLFCSVTADHNRRQGLSIIEVDGLIVTDSIFKSTRGTRPSSGIDLEPDTSDQAITNVLIQNSQFLDNVGAGLLIDGGKGPISNVEITNNVFAGNPRSIKLKHAPGVSANCGNELVSQSGSWSDLNAFVEAIRFAVASNDCAE
jgi:hypothetical protein